MKGVRTCKVHQALSPEHSPHNYATSLVNSHTSLSIHTFLSTKKMLCSTHHWAGAAFSFSYTEAQGCMSRLTAFHAG